MQKDQTLTTRRAVEVFEEMVGCRRSYCADMNFFRMDEYWEDLCDEEGRWKIKAYRSKETQDFKRKAGVIALADRVTLTVDERLMENAKRGCKLSNFILAHEAGHLALNHHARGAITKNFQLFSGPNGMSNIPPTLEELEANYAAVFLQCGVELLNDSMDPIQLAHRAFTDVRYVKKAQRMVRLDVFKRELARPRPKHERVVF
ncbi:MAG: hypothetical protein JJU15_12655 [Pararhodobacter sp.]|nr:hypothetical protein [Pararhodobacter sp.]